MTPYRVTRVNKSHLNYGGYLVLKLDDKGVDDPTDPSIHSRYPVV